MPETNQEIRTLLAPISGGTVLLPGSVVAEVISYSDLKPFAEAPAWLLGGIDWSDWNVPVISFAVLAGTGNVEKPTAKSRVLIVKSLFELSSTPYLGVLISGVPRLAKVKAGSLTKPKKLAEFPCVFREVTINEEQVVIPDMDELIRLVENAVNSD